MPDTAFLVMALDGPLQSWGFSSRFQRRTTGLHPTKSGVIGLLCAAMGLPKGSDEERAVLPEAAGLKMTTIVLPRAAPGTNAPLPILRLEDYHTVLGTRRASGKMNEDAVVTHRQYLLDARFGVILEGPKGLLERAAAALRDPVWGVWLGRKSCIPAARLFLGLFDTKVEAQHKLIGMAPIAQFTTVTEVTEFADGTDSIGDQPVSFGDATDSGGDQRQFAVRRVRVVPGSPVENRESGV